LAHQLIAKAFLIVFMSINKSKPDWFIYAFRSFLKTILLKQAAKSRTLVLMMKSEKGNLLLYQSKGFHNGGKMVKKLPKIKKFVTSI
jgi:hypothetical protein